MSNMTIADAHKLDVGEILKFSFEGVFKRRYWDLLAPCLVLGLLMGVAFLPFILNYGDFMSVTMMDPESDSMPDDFMSMFLPAWASAFFGGMLAYFLVTPYLLHRMRSIILGEYESVGTTIRKVFDFKRLFKMILSLVLGSIAYMLGAMMCLLPGLALIPTLYMIFPCATFGPEDDSFPLRTAFNTMRGNYSRTIGVLLALIAGGFAITMVVSIPAMFGQQDMMAMMGENPDPEAIMAMQKEMMFSAKLWIPNIVAGLVEVHLMLMGLFAILVIYMNPGQEPAADQIDELSV